MRGYQPVKDRVMWIYVFYVSRDVGVLEVPK